MLPLTADRPGDNWPRTVDVKLADGSKLLADVVWVHARFDAPPAAWTLDPRRLAMRAVDRRDDTSAAINTAAGEGPYMLLRLPADGEGPLRIEGREIQAMWRDVPWNDPLRDRDLPAPDAALSIEAAPDRPDPNSPFEFWRWVLLADRLGLRPPSPPGAGDALAANADADAERIAGDDDLQRLAAEHYAVLWRIAMQRLATLSPRIAHECRHALTRTAVDRHRTIAAWIADPQQVASLLATLLDFSRSDQQTLSAVVAWQDQLPSIMAWPEDLAGDEVQLAVAALRDDGAALALDWFGSEQPPSSVHLEPGIVAHLTVSRLPLVPAPALGGARLIEPSTQILRLTSGFTRIDVACGPRVVEARPPGVTFLPPAAPLTLADVQANRALAVPLERSTLVQVRRLHGRWEVFFECRRLDPREQTLDRDAIRTLNDLRGIEAVTLLIGRGQPFAGADDGAGAADAGGVGGGGDLGGDRLIWITAPEHDWPAVLQGPPSPDLQVHKRSFGDRWHCRIVLPEAWFSAGQSNPAFLAFIRSHGDNQQLETGPMPSPAWLAAPGRAALDLARWDDLPISNP